MNLSELLEQQTNETVRRDSAHIERGRYSSTRTPVIMLMDISTSMSLENKSVQMNEGAQASMREMRMNRRANNSCDFAALIFNDTVKVVQPFAPLPECPDLPLFRPDGRTKIAEAVLRGLAEIDAQEQKYQQNDTPYHCPMLWILQTGSLWGKLQKNSNRLLQKQQLGSRQERSRYLQWPSERMRTARPLQHSPVGLHLCG